MKTEKADIEDLVVESEEIECKQDEGWMHAGSLTHHQAQAQSAHS